MVAARVAPDPRAERFAMAIDRGPVELPADSWKTLESFWGKVSATTAYFRLPAGATIKVRYGYGWFGFDRQKQTLDGVTSKTLSVSGWVGYARMQARSSRGAQISWEIEIAGP
jgi:hypothetical protein